ncbi:MAG: hypothetical protein M3Q19_14365 [Pseudomonadota bacterium]|nr:hypothetical protein [Pseudomonadota bacterium]
MLKILPLALALSLAAPAQAGPAEDATAAVTSWIDKFNAGDLNAFYAAHAPDAVIIDEY